MGYLRINAGKKIFFKKACKRYLPGWEPVLCVLFLFLPVLSHFCSGLFLLAFSGLLLFQYPLPSTPLPTNLTAHQRGVLVDRHARNRLEWGVGKGSSRGGDLNGNVGQNWIVLDVFFHFPMIFRSLVGVLVCLLVFSIPLGMIV